MESEKLVCKKRNLKKMNRSAESFKIMVIPPFLETWRERRDKERSDGDPDEAG